MGSVSFLDKNSAVQTPFLQPSTRPIQCGEPVSILRGAYKPGPNKQLGTFITMISLLAVYTLVSIRVKAEDLANPSRDADSYRSLPNIIWSCLTTIFLCTWVSLHPNIPKPVDETKLSKRQRYTHKLCAFLKDQTLPFVLLLLAPEWVLMWALRQWLVVEYMVRNKQGVWNQ
ncbi:hypothetical protein FRC20_010597 [Serendipita sp. 405]|nr:hypothetical protein FRC20_010597 [Serendipita sp. 405]